MVWSGSQALRAVVHRWKQLPNGVSGTGMSLPIMARGQLSRKEKWISVATHYLWDMINRGENIEFQYLKTPIAMVISHCFQLSFTVDANFPRNSMMIIYVIIVTTSIY